MADDVFIFVSFFIFLNIHRVRCEKIIMKLDRVGGKISMLFEGEFQDIFFDRCAGSVARHISEGIDRERSVIY